MENNWDPNAFLSAQFVIHRKVLQSPTTNNFTELSSGVNYLASPSIWRETMHKELEENFLYQQYTSLEGFQTTRYAIKLYEKFLFSKGNLFFKADFDVCMTIGASQAADHALDYCRTIGKRKMLLVGLTYPLYATLGEKYGYVMMEARSAHINRDLPTVEELIRTMVFFQPDIIVLCHPANPSGEKYTDEELDIILSELSRKDIYCIFDCACNIVISKRPTTTPEPFLLKHKMIHKSIIINSFSKTESIPGFRIGYIVGNYNLIQFVKEKQVTIMNPPNIPAIAVWMIMLFRCLHLSEQFGLEEKDRQTVIRYYKKMYMFTTLLCPVQIREYINDLMDNRLISEYLKYKQELFSEEMIINSNKEYISKRLYDYIKEVTTMDSGFNYLIKLKTYQNTDEMKLCEAILRETGIAIFTESGFALNKANQRDYWIRISLALPEYQFHTAVDKLYFFINKTMMPKEQNNNCTSIEENEKLYNQ